MWHLARTKTSHPPTQHVASFLLTCQSRQPKQHSPVPVMPSRQDLSYVWGLLATTKRLETEQLCPGPWYPSSWMSGHCCRHKVRVIKRSHWPKLAYIIPCHLFQRAFIFLKYVTSTLSFHNAESINQGASINRATRPLVVKLQRAALHWGFGWTNSAPCGVHSDPSRSHP